MRTVTFSHKTSGLLAYENAGMPKARRNEVVVKIMASSLNPHDWKYYNSLKAMTKIPLFSCDFKLGHDLAGVVVEVGSNVETYKPGDEVYSMALKPGAFSEYAAIDQRMVSKKPRKLSFVEAGAIPMIALTALQFYKMAHLKSGEHVLVNGGSGGVGHVAIQIAKAKGAHVTTVCSSRNTELVKSLGADSVIDYTQEDTYECGKRFDVVFDTIGNMTLRQSKSILEENGRFLATTPNAGIVANAILSRLPGLTKIKTVTAIALPKGSDLDLLREMIDQGDIRVLVDREFPIEDLNGAIEYSKTGRVKGKIALNVAV
ncbi:MAG: NAD(P)-dependent alcohol dehydrogenase [Alcanivorax sp.]|nr:NAD(P)-dependent alcohol dehydrogenase [Alcanivorax sp.]